ncbi:MAG: thymidylate synthase ThyX [PVC group bacterium]|nr:thymidylate synthase ThyX [PVC group bacterium]
MKVKILERFGSWRGVADSANTTIHKKEGTKEPSELWKKRMLLCEHSPIRQIQIKARWEDLKSWVSVHFVRHKFGIEHWVRTQRTDRTGIDRNGLSQDVLVEHEFLINAQAIISISRKRLCKQASKETRQAWNDFLYSIIDLEPELFQACAPDCIYRGYCYEFKSCGFHKTDEFKEGLKIYRKGINE